MPKVQTAASSNATSLSFAGPYYCFLQHWPLGLVEAPLGGVAGLCGIASGGYTAFSEKKHKHGNKFSKLEKIQAFAAATLDSINK